MSEGIPYADIVILALVAGFILLRLRSVLGSKMGNDNPSYFNRPMTPTQEKQEPIVQIDEKSLKHKREESDSYLSTLDNAAIAETIHAIKAKDPSFTATRFIQGAKGAFEMVFDAFAKGDKQTLKMLLSDHVFQDFSKAIAEREEQDQKTETTLVSVQARDITQAELAGNMAQLTVHFLSEQVTLVRNGKGDIVEGDPSDIKQVEDHWTFERDVTSKNPNWKITET